MSDALKTKFAENNLVPYGAAPNYRQMTWYRREAAAFFHFGVNTFTGNEWGDGKERLEMFNPENLDCRQWIYTIKKAGFTTAILTAKHHDGFCLWPSKYSEHTVANTPYKNGKGDIVREFTDACHEYGIKVGIYLSPWDRNSPEWGTGGYNDYYTNQLTELFSNYGEICECWWDGAGSTEAVYDWGRWAYTVRNLQPDAVIFGSMGASEYVECRWVGNESGYASNPCWGTIDVNALHVEDTSILFSGTEDGGKFAPAEVDVSIRPGWFYHKEQDADVKTTENLVRYWFNSSGKNAGILLNFPPDRRGLIHEIDAANVQEAYNILSKTFSVNLLVDADVKTDSMRENSNCTAEKMLVNDFDCFYAASENNKIPVIEFTMHEKRKFNCFSFSEVIELGHRIREFEIEAFVNNEWLLLAKGNCVGYRYAEYFPMVESDKVRIRVTKAAAAPVIRGFGVYEMDERVYAREEKMKTTENLASKATAKIIKEGNETIVAFGGIYPFNTVAFNGKGVWSYSIYAFDGSNFYEIYKGQKPEENQVCTFDRIDNSYQIKIVIDAGSDFDIQPKVFDM